MPTILNKPEITMVSTTLLKPYKNNARTHSPKQIQKIANSIKEFGFTNPILIDATSRIMAGHGRVEAAKKLGIKQVPTISINHLSEDQIRAYILADNKIAEQAGWDNGMLAIELQHLSTVIDFDIEITGFETAEIDVITDEAKEVDPADNIPEADNSRLAVTQLGDIFQLGKHRLICGDSLKPETYKALMENSLADMIFTDPPYNLPVNGHVSGLGKIKHREFAMASGEMSPNEFEAFLKTFGSNVIAVSKDGSLHYICMDWRHIYNLLNAIRQLYTELKNICVWNKDNGGMGSLYRSKHELVAVFKHGTKPHTNNIELGKHGRYRTNVWDYAGVNSIRKGRMDDLAMHPTVKPVAMVADAIKDCTKRNQIVLDPFAGSGTTLIAAEKTGRIAKCIELDPHYCDVIIHRWQQLTCEDGVHLASGKTFSAIEGDENE